MVQVKAEQMSEYILPLAASRPFQGNDRQEGHVSLQIIKYSWSTSQKVLPNRNEICLFLCLQTGSKCKTAKIRDFPHANREFTIKGCGCLMGLKQWWPTCKYRGPSMKTLKSPRGHTYNGGSPNLSVREPHHIFYKYS